MGDGSLIGISSIVLNQAVIRAGSHRSQYLFLKEDLSRPGAHRRLPGKVVRRLTDESLAPEGFRGRHVGNALVATRDRLIPSEQATGALQPFGCGLRAVRRLLFTLPPPHAPLIEHHAPPRTRGALPPRGRRRRPPSSAGAPRATSSPRYRRTTGELDDTQLLQSGRRRRHHLRELEERRAAIVASIAGPGQADAQAERPRSDDAGSEAAPEGLSAGTGRSRTRLECGDEPLAFALLDNHALERRPKTSKYLNADAGLPTPRPCSTAPARS